MSVNNAMGGYGSFEKARRPAWQMGTHDGVQVLRQLPSHQTKSHGVRAQKSRSVLLDRQDQGTWRITHPYNRYLLDYNPTSRQMIFFLLHLRLAAAAGTTNQIEERSAQLAGRKSRIPAQSARIQASLGIELMAKHLTLDQKFGVRVPVPETEPKSDLLTKVQQVGFLLPQMLTYAALLPTCCSNHHEESAKMAMSTQVMLRREETGFCGRHIRRCR